MAKNFGTNRAFGHTAWGLQIGGTNYYIYAALQIISTVKNEPYNVPQSYSLSDTINILTAYNAPGIPPFTDLPSSYIPNSWFDNLPYEGNSKYGQILKLVVDIFKLNISIRS
ncbi:17995_t:CDS:2 [Cetraspora pellucida]|uniref:17995_t:CDS:1 n=1 Tax=Cetraspora pellucida TaxID=1433469 RepID=A0A9N9J366_9GLOM|nr:17995_t:CDS:2 [Cetraspora pellucida]